MRIGASTLICGIICRNWCGDEAASFGIEGVDARGLSGAARKFLLKDEVDVVVTLIEKKQTPGFNSLRADRTAAGVVWWKSKARSRSAPSSCGSGTRSRTR